MKTKNIPQARSREKILADLSTLPPNLQGWISQDKRVLASGKVAVYHNFQCKSNGKTYCVRIPAEKFEEVQKAVENGAKARELIQELSDATIRDILSDTTSLKKNS